MQYWLETLGCPKNQVDSDKLAGMLEAQGHGPASDVEEAELVVVNTCAFVEAARAESIETILDLSERRAGGARLVVTGCMAERYGSELAAALPEVDAVAGFGQPITLGPKPSTRVPAGRATDVARLPEGVAAFDLLELPRPPAGAPWAYLKVAEGCDRACGFCAIPSFRGKQRSRVEADLLAEVDALGASEIVLVAQDLASYGSDLGRRGAIIDLIRAVSERVARTRLLYLYPSALSPSLIQTMGETGCPYFDLSLQHVSGPLLRRMRRWGDGRRFAERIERIREHWPAAAFRSSFIVGYPGETEEDHDQLLRFLGEAELDWAGFFAFSPEAGTYAAELDGHVPGEVMTERLAECSEIQDAITARRRAGLIGTAATVLVDVPGVGRSHREAPEIDGIISLPTEVPVGALVDVVITGAEGPDLQA
ncbi:MAG: 30S ribosomal protein S12 methylthiotransferase RimO, partial [Actinomycetota bacterium]|nr:30S ribosomal protein S12 methylthiotransferase RimO [Actinomycetota bacterium]